MKNTNVKEIETEALGKEAFDAVSLTQDLTSTDPDYP